MLAEVITIGDELLLGQTVDTNSAWMGAELTKQGIALHRITSISDAPAEITAALEEAMSRVDLVLVTGGLGPTRDDLTKETLASFFGMPLVMNEQVLNQITHWFENRGMEMLPVNRDQAMLPEGCEILPNPRGTAMGMWFQKGDEVSPKVVVSLPGVPYEMKGLMEEEVLPRVQKIWKLPKRYHRTVLTQGIGESFLSALIEDWEDGLEERGIHIAYLPAPGQVRVRFSAVDDLEDAAVRRVEEALEEFLELAGQHVVALDEMSLPEAVVQSLVENNCTIATAESCTGGSIAASITAVPGSSAVFQGSIVAYANAVKQQMLGVAAKDIEVHGAVSEPVVMQMAKGVREKLGTTYGLATSGIAGPSGGTALKPVGTIWVGLAGPKGVVARKFQLGDHRGRNVSKTVLLALAWILEDLKQKDSQRS
ncbi:MAG: competence/damage-inducible protein A [Flavobacteriales bacterium]